MIEVKIIKEEINKESGEVINERVTARYTGEYARRYLRKHPDIYNNITIYDDVSNDKTFYNTHEILEGK